MRTDIEEIIEIGKKHSGKSPTTSNYGNDWSRAKKIRLCGIIYGEGLNSKGEMVPKHAWCRLPECDNCMSYRGDILATDTHAALGQAVHTNPKLKVYKRIISDNDGQVLNTFIKRIKYNGGSYKRYPLEDGVHIVITVLEDCFHPDKMDSVFGKEIKPRLTDDMYHTFSDMLGIDFKEVATYCRLSGKRVTGNLRKNSPESKNTFLLRRHIYVPKDASHMEKKQELDASFEMTMNDDLENNDGLQTELDDDKKARVAHYLDNGLDFSIRTDFLMVRENEFEKWNTAAKLHNLISPNKASCNGYEKKEHDALLGENVEFEGEAVLV